MAIAGVLTAALHLLLFQALMFGPPEKLKPIENVISVSFVTPPPAQQRSKPLPEPAGNLREIRDMPLPPPPKIKPVSQPAALSTPVMAASAPDILASSRPVTKAESGNTVPLPQSGPQTVDVHLEPSSEEKRIDEGLKSLAVELACLNGFSVDCADIRKDVFEEFQMTETDKIYTKKYAHTGMPVEFYGMSERQIRAKLNVPNAGENGLFIPFTNIGLDGGIWDVMHGVNKGCEWKAGITPEGNHAPIKDCPDYLPAAKGDRDRRNKFNPKALK